MSLDRDKFVYELLDECKCSDEEFFVLVSGIDWENPKELSDFLDILSDLIRQGYLSALYNNDSIDVSRQTLQDYVDQRLMIGEALDQYPISGQEFSFETTEEGIRYLNPEDRPI